LPDPAYPVRDRLVAQIAEAAAPFDGVQIDFEKVHSADRDNFVEFLTLVRAAIGNRTLTVALPARVRKVDDPYDYARIGPIVDRIIVMAYDEH
jgi:spore germination protein YaaH